MRFVTLLSAVLFLLPMNALSQTTLKEKVQGAVSTKVLKTAGVLACPKGQACYCGKTSLACRYYDKHKVVIEVAKYSSVEACVSLCLGKTMNTVSKNDVK